MTASGNISASGTVYVKGSSTSGVYVNNEHALGTSTTVTEGAVFGATSWTAIHIGRDGTNNKNIELHGPVTASGNISASGIVRADAFESRTGGQSIDFKDSINVTGNLTASGDMSLDDITATGNISGSITSTGSFGIIKTSDDRFIGDLTAVSYTHLTLPTKRIV